MDKTGLPTWPYPRRKREPEIGLDVGAGPGGLEHAPAAGCPYGITAIAWSACRGRQTRRRAKITYGKLPN